MVPPLTTKRLLLQPLTLADAAQVQPLFAEWDVVKHLTASVQWPFPPDGALTYYRDAALPAMQRGDEWHWTLRLRELPEQVIGSVALLRNEKNNRGFWLGVPWRGQGLMTEAVEAATDFWFEVLGFELLRAPKASANIGSVRISQRTGMRLESRHTQGFVSGELPAEVWVITRDEWLRHKEQRRSEERR